MQTSCLLVELLNVIAEQKHEKVSFAQQPSHINMDQVKALFFTLLLLKRGQERIFT